MKRVGEDVDLVDPIDGKSFVKRFPSLVRNSLFLDNEDHAIVLAIDVLRSCSDTALLKEGVFSFECWLDTCADLSSVQREGIMSCLRSRLDL